MKRVSFIYGVTLLLVGVAVGQGAFSALGKEASVVLCAGNLKDLVTATAHYAVDHEGELPPGVDRTKKPWRWWYFELFPYVSSMRAFYCPEKAPDFYTEGAISPLLPVTWDYRFLSYAYNQEIDLLQRKGDRILLKRFNEPPRVLFAESNDYFVQTDPGAWSRQIAARHEGRAHFARSDGSVVLEVPGSPPSASGEGIHQLNQWQIR